MVCTNAKERLQQICQPAGQLFIGQNREYETGASDNLEYNAEVLKCQGMFSAFFKYQLITLVPVVKFRQFKAGKTNLYFFQRWMHEVCFYLF